MTNTRLRLQARSGLIVFGSSDLGMGGNTSEVRGLHRKVGLRPYLESPPTSSVQAPAQGTLNVVKRFDSAMMPQ